MNDASSFAGARAENYSSVFLNPDHYAEKITQYPLGVAANAVAGVVAIVHKQDEGETPIDDERGSVVIRWCTVSLPATLSVTIDERSQQRDQFLIDGELWHAEKILKRTPYRLLVRLKREEKASTKRTRLS